MTASIARMLAVVLLAGCALTPLIDSASAGRRVMHHYEVDAIQRRSGYVTAESDHGHGKITAPVRRTSRGWQVRLPGGEWVDCLRSCTNTLRVKTVDVWETWDQFGKGDGGPGYLRWEFRY
jgi:hypothetical protein